MLNWLFGRKAASSSPDVDITSLWDRQHPHLRPLKSYLQLPGVALVSTPVGDGIKLFANIRLGETWVPMMPVLYVPASDRYHLLAEDRLATVPDPEALGQAPVTAVDARLWFAEPTFLNIEPTTRCNFNCWYCVGRHMKQEDIRLEDFARVLDHFPALQTIALVGEGEPLLHKDFFTMAGMARDRGIRVMIISNGSAFSTSVVKKLCEAEVAYVSISIDSANPETFAQSRLDGDLNKIWQGIERLRAYRDEHGYQYPRIAVKGTLFRHTEDELLSVVEAAKSHGVEIFESFQALNPMRTYVPIYPEGKRGEIAHIDEVAGAIGRDSAKANQMLTPMADFCREAGIDFSKMGRANPLRKNCDEQWIYSLLSGDVTPCCQIKTPISPTWNLVSHPLADILADPAYENVRFNLWNGLFPDYCEGCWKTR